MTTASGHTSAIRANKVIGTGVKNRSGENIGKVEDVVLDKLSDNILFAVVGFGGFLGMNEKSARDAATNKCLAGAGLLSKQAAAETRSGAGKSRSTGSGGARMTAGERARSEPGAGPAWVRRSIRSQQQ